MEKKPKLRGNRIFIELPDEKKTKLTVDHNTKEALEKEMLIKMNKVKVHSVGDLISDIKPGDVILVEPLALQRALTIPLNDKERVGLISTFDVIMIW
jgi:hypothetical protein